MTGSKEIGSTSNKGRESIKLNIPSILLPEGSKEGDILNIDIHKDEKETEAVKKGGLKS